MKKKSTETFIDASQIKHGEKYDYSRVVYTRAKDKVCIICHEKDVITGKEHGEFWQEPRHHKNGVGCPKCAKNTKMTHQEWVNKAYSKWGETFDYSKSVYTNSSSKVCIICHKKDVTTGKEHGEFWQNAASHLSLCGCPKCNGGVSLTTNEYIVRCEAIHGKYYDYSKVVYTRAKDKVCVVCPIHKDFWQEANSHVEGKGCPKCKNSKLENILMVSLNKEGIAYNHNKTFKEMGQQNFDFYLPHHKIIVECQGEQHYKPINFSKDPKNTHADIQKIYEERVLLDVAKKDFCKRNNITMLYFTIPNFFTDKSINIFENTIYTKENTFFDSRDIVKYINTNFNTITSPIDSFVAENFQFFKKVSHNIYTYGEKYFNFIPLSTIKCSRNWLERLSMEYNNKIVHIFEDEIVNTKNIVISKINHILGIHNNVEKIGARKCYIKEVNYKTAFEFLRTNHIQSGCASTIYLGLYFNDEVVAIMTFKTIKDGVWDLTRFATIEKYIVQGGASKLLQHFVNLKKPSKIVSFADKRWTLDGNTNLYTKLGFIHSHDVQPSYSFIDPSRATPIRIHKSNFRKNRLLKKYPNLTQEMTEDEMTKKLGYKKIWGRGLFCYTLLVS